MVKSQNHSVQLDNYERFFLEKYAILYRDQIFRQMGEYELHELCQALLNQQNLKCS